jgi:hypothetical protein
MQKPQLVAIDANVLVQLLFRELDLAAPVIATPREVVTKFYR